MRWIVVGAGAVGASIGGRLALSGADVVLVARGDHGAALAERGLVLRTPQGVHELRLPVASGPADVALQPDDVLLLAVKTQATAAAVRDWALAPVAGGGTAGQRLPVVCAQNGLENERLAARWFDVVVGACVWLPATHLSPGEVTAVGAPLTGMLQLGVVTGPGRAPAAARAAAPGSAPAGVGDDPAPDPLASSLARALTVDHLRATARADVLRWKRGKLVDNLANGLDALLDGPRSAWRDLATAAFAEGRAALAAHGLDATSREEELAERGALVDAADVPGAPRGGSSTWQSLARGRETEVEHLNGEVAMLGRTAGVATPVNSAVARLVTQGQRERRGPRWMPPDALRRELVP